MYENQLGALTNQQFNVEQTNFALQSMQDNVQTVRAMQAAGKQLKQNFKQPELNINKIENMQDDMADLMVRPIVVGGTGSGQQFTAQGQHCDLSLHARGCLSLEGPSVKESLIRLWLHTCGCTSLPLARVVKA